MKYNIALVGTFDVENFGDLLFPNVFEHYSKDFVNNLYLFSPNGKGPKPFEPNTHVFAISELEEFCKSKKIQAIIIGGGDIIRIDTAIAQDYTSTVEASLDLFITPILIGTKYNLPVLFNTPGIPFEFDSKEVIIGLLLNRVRYLSIRDRYSYNNLPQINKESAILVPDTVIGIKETINNLEISEIFKNISSKINIKEKKYIVVQLNNSTVINDIMLNEIYIKLIQLEKMYQIVLLPIGYVHNDNIKLNQLKTMGNNNFIVFKNKLSPIEMIAILSNAKFYVGTSMHGAVVSYAYNVNFAIFNFNNLTKINGFANIIKEKNVLINNINDLDIIDNLIKQSEDNKKRMITRKQITKTIKNHFITINNSINDFYNGVSTNTFNIKTAKQGLVYIFSNIDNQNNKIEQLKKKLEIIENSRSYKIARKISKILGTIRKRKD